MGEGGQQAYWDLLPVFAHDTSATLFVHRLCEKLDEYPRNDLYQRGKQVGPSQKASLTTAEAFKTMLRGLHTRGKGSKIITVGTHKDMVDDCEETPEEKSKKFSAIATPHFKDSLVYRSERMEETVFKINTKNPDCDDKKEAAKIKACVEKCAKEHEIPIWWFILQLILEALALRLGREVLSKEEVVDVSNSLGFSEGELDAVLAFFDKLNIFLYKKTILPTVVFTNAQVPLDKLSRLVEKQYHLRAALADPTKAADHAMTGDWQKFRDNGILTLDFLEEFKDHYVEGIFTAEDFLVLLKKLLVIAPLSGAEYFLPALLDMTTEAKIKASLESTKSTKIAALVVEFPTGWAPPGVYCCSVCHLQSHSKWKVVKKPSVKSRSSMSSTPHAHTCLQEFRPPIKPRIKVCSTPLAHSAPQGDRPLEVSLAHSSPNEVRPQIKPQARSKVSSTPSAHSAAEGDRPPIKPRSSTSLAHSSPERETSRGLTPSGEEWASDVLLLGLIGGLSPSAAEWAEGVLETLLVGLV